MASRTPRFLDTNVLLRFFVPEYPDMARHARALFLRVERGEEKVTTSPMVVFETVFTLQRTYGVPRAEIRERLLPLLSLRGLELPEKTVHVRALDVYASTTVSFADAYSVAFMEAHGLTEIYSWDTDFDRVRGVDRVEPSE
jgi:predicted nucleic acid-binding protein